MLIQEREREELMKEFNIFEESNCFGLNPGSPASEL